MTVAFDLGTAVISAAFFDGSAIRIITDDGGEHSGPAYSLKEILGRRTTLLCRDGQRSPEEILAHRLRRLRRSVEGMLGREVRRAALTVPARFDVNRRNAVIEAALLAGFERAVLLDEPIAAVYAHARYVERGFFVVCDFGAGSLDVTCVEKSGMHFVVHAAGGDRRISGRAIDRVVSEYLLRNIGDISGLEEELRRAAEEIKVKLSVEDVASISVSAVYRSGGESSVDVTISRDEFESLLAPFLERMVRLVADTLQEARWSGDASSIFILAGGMTAVPAVAHTLCSHFPVEPTAEATPRECVIRGAALFAARTGAERLPNRRFLPATLAVELSDGRCTPLLRRYRTLPASVSASFTTVADDQAEAEIHLVQGDAGRASDNRSLCRLTLTGLPGGPHGSVPITVALQVDEDGVVTVTAHYGQGNPRVQRTAHLVNGHRRGPLEGDRTSYFHSLIRRGRVLSTIAGGMLRREISETVDYLAGWNTANPSEIDNAVTVLETLVEEVIAERDVHDEGGAGRAAS